MTTPHELMAAAGLRLGGSVPWGKRPGPTGFGVYVVAVHSDPRCDDGPGDLVFDMAALGGWLERRPELTLHGHCPSVGELAEHLARWWLPSEPVLYIGRATSLSSRLSQYYRTELGARGPHRGGAWINTIVRPRDLTVHWASPVDNPVKAEERMLLHFAQTAFAAGYPDPPVRPWANLDSLSGSGQRAHGLRGHVDQSKAGPQIAADAESSLDV